MTVMRRITILLLAFLSQFAATAQHTVTVGKTLIGGADSLLFSPDRLYWGEGVISSGATEITGMEQTLSSGAALADIRAVTYEDGAPVIEGGKLYLTGSARTGGSGIAILALTLGTGELEFTGTINPLMSGVYRKLCAPHIMYDRIRKVWQVTTPYHSPDNHLLWVATAYNDIRFGVSTLDFSPLDYQGPKKGDEDCQIFYDAGMGRWVMIYASTRRPDGGSGYILRLQTSPRPDGGFRDFSYQTDVSATGVTSTMIGGKRYVLSGNERGDGRNRYSVWSYPEMEFVCDLNMDIDDGAWRGWNNVVPVPEGSSTRYVMLGFDRQKSTDEDNWTYGNNYFLYSRQRNPGREFPVKDGDGKVIREASEEFTYQVGDLEFLRRGSRRFAFNDILLGRIDLQYDITAPNGNVYPSVGTVKKLEYHSGRLRPVTDAKGDAAVICGIHHPTANYLMPLDGIADGDSRYVYIGSKDGGRAARVLATRVADEIKVTFEGCGEPSVIGSFPCPLVNGDTLRICMCMGNLTGKNYIFAFCHRERERD